MKRISILFISLFVLTFCVNGQSSDLQTGVNSPRHLTVEGVDLGRTKNFTFETRVRLTGIMSDFAAIVSFRPTTEGLILRRLSNEQYRIVPVSDFATTVTPILTTSAWFHIAYVMQNDSSIMYVNGSPYLISNLPKDSVDFLGDLILGRESAFTNRHFAGRISEFRLWDRSLSQMEILNLALNDCPIDSDEQNGLIIYYDFNPELEGQNYITNLADLSDERANSDDLVLNVIGAPFTSHTKSAIRKPIVYHNPEDNRFFSKNNLPENELTFQWVDCGANQDINGADESSFQNQTSGSFALKASNNGCELVANCMPTTGIAPLNYFSVLDSNICEGSDLHIEAEFDVSNINFNYEIAVMLFNPVAGFQELANLGANPLVDFKIKAENFFDGKEVMLELRNLDTDQNFVSRRIPLAIQFSPVIVNQRLLTANRSNFCPNTAGQQLNMSLTFDLTAPLVNNITPGDVFRLKRVTPDLTSSTLITEYIYTGLENTAVNILQVPSAKVYDAGLYFIEVDNECGTLVYSDTLEIEVNCGEGRSYLFNQNSEVVSVANPDFNYSGSNYTIECWMRSTLTQNQYAGVAVSRPGGHGIIFAQSNFRLTSLELYDSNNGPIISQNIWYHVALVKNGNRLSIFANGEEYVLSTNFTTPTNFTQNLSIGNDLAVANRNFRGNIDDVRFWTRALSQEEIQAHYESKCPISTDDEDLLMYFDFNTPQIVSQTLKSRVNPQFETNSVFNFSFLSPLKADFIEPIVQINNNSTQAKALVEPNYLPYAYQWFDCLLEEDITGAKDSTFALNNFIGNVGVEVSYKGCSLSSLDCPEITVSSPEITSEATPLFYPNPANTWIYTSEWVNIYDLNGKIVLNGKNYISIENLSLGIYLVVGENTQAKLIVQ